MCSLVSITGSTPLLFRLTANLSLAAATTAPSKSGTFPLAIATRRWPGARASKFFPQVFPPGFCWFVYWHLTNTVSNRWFGVPMEKQLRAVAMITPSRFGTRNLEIASRRWPGTGICKFEVFPLCFFGFVCWLHLISGSTPWRGAPMESKLPAAAGTIPSRFGTRNLEIASRHRPGTRASKFFPQVFSSWFLLIRVLTSHKYSVNSVVWSPDGKQIASGSDDTTIKIWDLQSGDCQSTLSGHSAR